MNTYRKFFRLLSPPESKPAQGYVDIGTQRMPVLFRRHARAKNYVLRLLANRTVVVTLPRRGSLQFAQEFVVSRQSWLEKQWKVLEARKIPPQVLRPGMEILFRGRVSLLELERNSTSWHLRLHNERFPVDEHEGDLRPALEAHMRQLAETELNVRVEELAAIYQSPVTRVVVRNQKSRWGSCSCKGTISLNWRLVQVPAHVRDYIIVHELMHLRELNHSARFWAQVERVCPNYRDAELWLRENSGRVGF